MTFIASLKVKNGIIQVSDSRETEDDEATERNRRIITDNATKTFQISSHSCLQVAGNAMLKGVEIEKVIEDFRNKRFLTLM